jgi:hypothetical protein
MEESRRAVVSKHFGPEEGPAHTWPELRRRAYGGFHLRTALDHLQSGDMEQGQNYLRQAFITLPAITENLEAFYELACANQPAGVRGLVEYLDLESSIGQLFSNLDVVFDDTSIPHELRQRRKEAYASAHLAVGLLAYANQDMSRARRHLYRALRLWPSLSWQPTVMSTLVKSILGFRLVSMLKRLPLIPRKGQR